MGFPVCHWSKNRYSLLAPLIEPRKFTATLYYLLSGFQEVIKFLYYEPTYVNQTESRVSFIQGVCSYRLFSIHGFHPQSSVGFRESLKGDDTMPVGHNDKC